MALPAGMLRMATKCLEVEIRPFQRGRKDSGLLAFSLSFAALDREGEGKRATATTAAARQYCRLVACSTSIKVAKEGGGKVGLLVYYSSASCLLSFFVPSRIPREEERDAPADADGGD